MVALGIARPPSSVIEPLIALSIAFVAAESFFGKFERHRWKIAAAFGLIHGKAGVLRYADGTATSFMGSVNESLSAWKLNYELLWEDNDPATIAWVQEEFDALWNDPRAVDLACCPFIAQDVERIISRKVVEPAQIQVIEDTTVAAAAAAVETPVYRREQGLWPHQKYFARLALERHRLGGARAHP